jgi:prephenate dehydrogenase
MPTSLPFRRAAVLGTGLIGGSFALAMRKQFPEMTVAGFDRKDVAKRALSCGAIQESAETIEEAVRAADLVYVALPIGATIQALPAIASAVPSGALVTDASSAKSVVCAQAASRFETAARFLGGHPMAGKEVSGVENASADLFAGAPYALIAPESDADPRVRSFADLLRVIGAKPLWCDADRHDWAVGIVSHLPQLVALALARVIADETDETGMPIALAGRGLQDTLRLAGSPYGVWRDVFLANRENVSRALERLGQEIEYLRRNLSTKELEEEFRAANDLFALLHKEEEKAEG